MIIEKPVRRAERKDKLERVLKQLFKQKHPERFFTFRNRRLQKVENGVADFYLISCGAPNFIPPKKMS
jgi:hypothetical protein